MRKKPVVGSVLLNPWTPAKAAGAARRRIEKIKMLLQEIQGLYAGIDQYVDDRCDELAAQLRGEGGLDGAIQYALETKAGDL